MSDPCSAKIKKILEAPLWIQELKTQEVYSRLHDDHDGERKGHIMVQFTPDGDAWVNVDQLFPSLRFRTFGGGGVSLRTRNALVILAYAMKLDDEKRLPG